MIHECRNVGNHFICAACPFTGNLEEAVAHAYKNQFEVRYDPRQNLRQVWDDEKPRRIPISKRTKREKTFQLQSLPRRNK